MFPGNEYRTRQAYITTPTILQQKTATPDHRPSASPRKAQGSCSPEALPPEETSQYLPTSLRMESSWKFQSQMLLRQWSASQKHPSLTSPPIFHAPAMPLLLLLQFAHVWLAQGFPHETLKMWCGLAVPNKWRILFLGPLTEPGMLLAFFVTKVAGSCSVCCPARSRSSSVFWIVTSSLYHFVRLSHPRNKVWHSSLLSFSSFLSDCFFSRLKSLWRAALPSSALTASPNLATSAELSLIIHWPMWLQGYCERQQQRHCQSQCIPHPHSPCPRSWSSKKICSITFPWLRWGHQDLPENGCDICVFPALFRWQWETLQWHQSDPFLPRACPAHCHRLMHPQVASGFVQPKHVRLSPAVNQHPLLQQATPQDFTLILSLTGLPAQATPAQRVPSLRPRCLTLLHASLRWSKPIKRHWQHHLYFMPWANREFPGVSPHYTAHTSLKGSSMY